MSTKGEGLNEQEAMNVIICSFHGYLHGPRADIKAISYLIYSYEYVFP